LHPGIWSADTHSAAKPVSAGHTTSPVSLVPQEDRAQGKVAVIVLGYNDRKWLDKCFTSVLSTLDGNFQVIYVDNASTDGSVEFVRERFPEIMIVRNKTNLGFAGGNNEGIRVALDCDADFVFLLNSDTWVSPTWLAEMRKHFADEPSLDVITAMILNYEDGRFDRNFLQLVSNTPDFVQDAWNGTRRPWYDTTSGSGAALMARRAFYEDVGVIDPVFFMYFEEIDLLRRGRFQGKRVAVSTTSIVHHFNHLETPDSGKPSKMRFERAYLIYTLKNQFDPLLKCVLKFLVQVVSRPIGAVFRGQWKRAWLLVRADVELLLKSPWILYRRHLEIHSPERLPEMTWLRPSRGQKA
jgi:GT2 family glycosyltransferase